MSVLIKLRDANHLTEVEKQLRDYILRHPKEVLDMTVHTLAKESFTSSASVIRLCKKIEVAGFTKFKVLLSSEINAFKEIILHLVDNTNIDPKDTSLEIVDKITNILIQSIEETRILLDVNNLQKAISLLLKANIIDFYGAGASHIVALDATYKFMRIGKMVSCYSLIDRQQVQAINSNKDHVAVIFSYSGETKAILEIVNTLKANGTPVISITANSSNSLSKLADINLYVVTKETLLRSGASASRSTSLFIVDVLYSLYCKSDYDHVSEMIVKTRIVG